MAKFDLNKLLNEKSKKNSSAEVKEEKAEAQGKNFEIVMIDVEDLMPSKDNFYAPSDITELANSIELIGAIEQNLVVKPEAHGKYEVIAGHRRRLAVLKLVAEGKERYRKVPCMIKKESDQIKDKLSLILTNATARQLSDWEKVQQAKQLKEILEEYKKALQKENKNRPQEERERIGRIRDIVAEILHISTTQVGRLEAINNNLSTDLKTELQKGNINISTAHELSKLKPEKQKAAHQEYKKKEKLQIKDVKKVTQKESVVAPAEGVCFCAPQEQEDANNYFKYTSTKFAEWIEAKYKTDQYSIIKEIKKEATPEKREGNTSQKEWENQWINASYKWMQKEIEEFLTSSKL